MIVFCRWVLMLVQMFFFIIILCFADHIKFVLEYNALAKAKKNLVYIQYK